MPSAIYNPVDEEVAVVEVEPPPEAGTHNFGTAFMFKYIDQTFNLLEPVGRLWINYFPRAFGEETVIMPPSSLTFMISCLYAFAEIKSQGSEFPFQTHPRSTNLAVTSLLFYGVASTAEHIVSATRLGPASVYAIIARLGRICCLCVLLKALGSMNLEIDTTTSTKATTTCTIKLKINMQVTRIEYCLPLPVQSSEQMLDSRCSVGASGNPASLVHPFNLKRGDVGQRLGHIIAKV
ncbi:unnamed protein product [Lactuca saligna]|uniref:Uncharacterized protein n=1 Tax=Lactuca saligna TaxID=75948 RepID=A0AA36EF60_LACSI|nr:unnamed protein product [Lactuca saligna]